MQGLSDVGLRTWSLGLFQDFGLKLWGVLAFEGFRVANKLLRSERSNDPAGNSSAFVGQGIQSLGQQSE